MMNEFPELVLAELFSFFSFRERCLLRAVNRHWWYVIEKYPKERLSVCHPTSQFLDVLDPQDVLLVDRPLQFISIFTANLKRTLCELRLFASPITADLQNELSLKPDDFGRLKVLKIDGLLVNVKQFRLALPTLHTLSLKCFSFGQGVLLDCPNLQRLTIHNSPKQQIVINQPEGIKQGIQIEGHNQTEGHNQQNDYNQRKGHNQSEITNQKGIRFLECQYLNESFKSLHSLEHLIALRIEFPLVEFRKLKRVELYPAWQDFDQLLLNLANERHLLNPEVHILINGFAWPDDLPVDLRLFDLHKAHYQGSEKFLFLGKLQDSKFAR